MEQLQFQGHLALTLGADILIYRGGVLEAGKKSDSAMTLAQYGSWMPFYSHANAPYIGPRSVFEGRITFENMMKIDGCLRRGMKQAELVLLPLEGLGNKHRASRYDQQQGATLSR